MGRIWGSSNCKLHKYIYLNGQTKKYGKVINKLFKTFKLEIFRMFAFKSSPALFNMVDEFFSFFFIRTIIWFKKYNY